MKGSAVRNAVLPVVLLVGLLAACSQGPAATASVTMQDIAFAPSTLTVAKDQAVRLTVRNTGALVHDFTVDRIAASSVRSKGSTDAHDMTKMSGPQPTLHVAVATGTSGELEFRPTEAGDYEFYCTVTGHREAGMRGTLRVQ